jgi:hypothetical protein
VSSRTTTHQPTTRRRLRCLAAALIAVPAVVLATPGAADAATTHNRVDAAAGWLGRQLNSDHLMTVSFDVGGKKQTFTDYGLTADTVLALDAAQVGRGSARAATKALAGTVLDYTGGGDATEFYAGAFAKLLVLAAAQGRDAHAFGNGPRKDLVAELTSLECTHVSTGCTAADRGRFHDVSAFGDNSGTIGQSLALVGLQRTTRRGPSPASVAFLVGQQCANGGFPEKFDQAACATSVDATGFAAQALKAVGSPAATAAAAKAGRWLRSVQHANGSFTGTGTRNANTTALAEQGLAVTGHAKAAARARAFLRGLQVRCGGSAATRGEIRYAHHAKGDAARATSQAVPALARVSLATVTVAGSHRGLPRLAC